MLRWFIHTGHLDVSVYVKVKLYLKIVILKLFKLHSAFKKFLSSISSCSTNERLSFYDIDVIGKTTKNPHNNNEM